MLKCMYGTYVFTKTIWEGDWKSVNTLQKWDRKGILPAFRSPTNRRYYTHEQYLAYRG